MTYFSRLSPRPEALRRRELRNQLFDGYGAHRLIWSVFRDDPDRQRDFIFRLEMQNRIPTFYCVSMRPPARNDNFRTEIKPYDPKLRAGERFRFKLRVNPIVARRREGQSRGAKHDVVMDAKRSHRAAGTKLSQAELVQQAATEWLETRAERLGFCFAPGHVLAMGYQRHRFWRGRGKQPIQLSTVDFEGELEVLDAETFRDTLFHGIGPAKAFGCGLLLVRRALRQV